MLKNSGIAYSSCACGRTKSTAAAVPASARRCAAWCEKTGFKKMEDGEGWRVFLNGVQLGTVRPFVRHGLKDRKMYRAYRGISLIASEHDTRAAAVARLVRDASIPDPGG